jgi:hypothetical protein
MVDLSAELLGRCLYHKVVDQNVYHYVKVSEMVYITNVLSQYRGGVSL